MTIRVPDEFKPVIEAAIANLSHDVSLAVVDATLRSARERRGDIEVGFATWLTQHPVWFYCGACARLIQQVARPGAGCPRCGSSRRQLRRVRVIEVAS